MKLSYKTIKTLALTACLTMVSCGEVETNESAALEETRAFNFDAMCKEVMANPQLATSGNAAPAYNTIYQFVKYVHARQVKIQLTKVFPRDLYKCDEVVSQFIALRWPFKLTGKNIDQLTVLPTFYNITDIDLSNNKLNSFLLNNVSRVFPNAVSINLSKNEEIKSCGELFSMRGLKKVNLANTRVAKLENCFSGSIVNLDISNTNVNGSTLRDVLIKQARTIEVLKMAYVSPVEKFSMIAGMPNLRYLDIAFSGVNKFDFGRTPTRVFESLQVLDAYHSSIENEDVAGFKNLKYFDTRGTEITEAKSLENLEYYLGDKGSAILAGQTMLKKVMISSYFLSEEQNILRGGGVPYYRNSGVVRYEDLKDSKDISFVDFSESAVIKGEFSLPELAADYTYDVLEVSSEWYHLDGIRLKEFKKAKSELN